MEFCSLVYDGVYSVNICFEEISPKMDFFIYFYFSFQFSYF